ncbi:hypothetical protein [Flavobacterium sp.]|uniref:hypothetical protein n=1 Tax=Flavobacterium sp. TaxID=239 RepID=UPI00260F31C7|nr:hypothetical protein [Flavobacterium sp.]
MRKNKKYIQFIIVMALLLGSTLSTYAQDDDGPVTPPDAAPINDWLTYAFFVGVSVGAIVFLKRKKTISN